MSLLLAPYNESIKLGQGFNSYTQERRIDDAVAIKYDAAKTTKTPPQIVSYSSRFVEKLSDLVDTMNVSYGATIKRGTIEISGNAATLDETKFKSADLNAIVSVRVTNQDATAPSTSTFRGLDGVIPGTPKFNEVYGDCYISGFIHGGDFTGVISIRVLNRDNVQRVTNEIKSALGSYGKDELSLDPLVDGLGSLSASSLMQETEYTVSVSWMGGGQIKDANTQWDLNSMFAAAAAFPSKVAVCPQVTWAVLTKYTANRSFLQEAQKSKFRSLEYDQISSYTAELFDNFMDYKILLKNLQHIIKNRDNYLVAKTDSGTSTTIDLSIRTLLSVRSALRDEQAKIVNAIEVLSKDPQSLRRKSRNGHRSYQSLIVRKIITEAVGDVWGGISDDTSKTDSAIQETETKESQSDDKSLDEEHVSRKEGNSTGTITASQTEDYDFDKLIPPEVWEEVMPRLKHGQPGTVSGAQGISNPTGDKRIIPAPVEDNHQYPDVVLTGLRDELQACKATLLQTESDLQGKANLLQQALDDDEKQKSSVAEAGRLKTIAENSLAEYEKAYMTLEKSCKSAELAKAALEHQTQALKGELEDCRRKHGEEKAKADSFREELLVTKSKLLDSHPRGRIWISAVYWGDKRIDTAYPEILDRLYDLAKSKEMFTPNVKFFNNENPWDGTITLFIEYRVDDTGPMRYLVLREGRGGCFPEF